MRFIVANYGSFEPWDWRNPDTQGIGGSETAAIEVARRLANRGHDVTVYAPTPEDATDDPNEGHPVKWRNHRELMKNPDCKHVGQAIWNIDQPGHWIHFRHPAVADFITNRQDHLIAQTHTLVCEDVVYFEADGSDSFTESRCAKFDHILALCPTHAAYLFQEYLFLKDKLCIWSNGIETDRIVRKFKMAHEQPDGSPPEAIRYPLGAWNNERAPTRLIWASSSSLELEALLHIFRRAVEFEPTLELHAFYGFDNWDKVIGTAQVKSGYCLEEKTRAWIAREKYDSASGDTVPDSAPIGSRWLKQVGDVASCGIVKYKHPLEYGRIACMQEGMKKRITDLIETTPNVFWHGRINQPRLWEEFSKSAIWCYPTTFTETSCCTCMLAQALGAIPITNKYWAVGHNVNFGHFIDGDPMKDLMCRARYVQAILHYARQPDLCNSIRADMMPWARSQFDWDKYVGELEGWVLRGVPHNVFKPEEEAVCA